MEDKVDLINQVTKLCVELEILWKFIKHTGKLEEFNQWKLCYEEDIDKEINTLKSQRQEALSKEHRSKTKEHKIITTI